MSGALTAFAIACLTKCIENILRFWKSEHTPAKVLVTGAAGEIGYAIVPMIARGLMLGAKQPVILHMLDKDVGALEEVKMELIDAALPLLRGVVATNKPEEACKGVEVAVMIGGLPRTEGMKRKDVKSKDVSTYEAQAWALGKHADKDCKVLVVENPANAKALKLGELATPIPKKNITYLTRLEHNRALRQIAEIANEKAKGQIAEEANVQVSDVKNVIIRGNDYSTQYPDVNQAIVTTTNGEKSFKEYVANDHWLKSKLKTTVERDAANSRARKRSSALSTASSACDHVRDWLLGTPEGTCVSMGVHSDESDGIYSFPVICDGGEWSIVKKFDETTKKPIVDKKNKKKKAEAHP